MNILRAILGWCVCIGAFLVYTGLLLVLAMLRPRRDRKPRMDAGGLRLLITGRFDSRNWCQSHLMPLVQARCVRELIAVVDGPRMEHPKIRYVSPPRWLRKLLGRSPARSLWVLHRTWRDRPDAVLGYHFFPAALSALLAARLNGAAALYSITAGPVELKGGGVATESPFVRRSNPLTHLLEPLALELCRHFDTIVVRGQQARQYLLQHRAARSVAVIPGSIDAARFQTNGAPRDYDLVFVGRLVPVKQPEQFVRVVDLLRRRRPNLRAALVGDGPLMLQLRSLADSLGVNGALQFLGHVERVEQIVARSRVFTLTSRSEGLSIAMAEAMAAGVVPVVADVGDLGELVHNDDTGWRIPPGDLEGYAERIDALLRSPSTWARLSQAARVRARENNSLEEVTRRWERLLAPSEDSLPARAPVTRAPGPAPPSSQTGSRHLWSNRSHRIWQDRIPGWLKRAATGPLHRIPPQWLLGYPFAKSLRFVHRAEHWSADEARAYQLAQLRRICTLAYEHAPFYRRLFDEVSFDPHDLRRVEDLTGLPTINKDTLRAHLREMCTVPPHAPGVDAVATAGTGGAPLHFYMNSDRAAVEYAHLVASWQRVGYALGTPLAVFRGRVVAPAGDGFRHEYDPLLRHHYYSVFHLSDENMQRDLDHVRSLGPCFLHVYPSAIAALARFVRRTGHQTPANVRGVIAESEIVYPDQRQRVEEVFGCRYFSCYGHTEKLVLAAECEHSTDYHVWPTYGYFELLDAAGRPVTTPGQAGEIVATGFINTVVPFIRYRTGDWATYVGPGCSACGRQHPLIRDIRGHRAQEFLIASDGTEIPWVALNMHDDTFIHVRQFQFYQDTPGYAVLRIVRANGFGAPDRERILSKLQSKLDGQLVIDIETTHSIPLSPRGKSIYVLQRTPHPDHAPLSTAHESQR